VSTRERILDAATEVFVERGFAGARMQEIADRAEVNKAMLHYYFTDKDHLYETVLVSMARSLFEGVRTTFSDEALAPAERLRRAIETYFDFIAAHPEFPKLILQDVVTGGATTAEVFCKAQEAANFLGAKPALDRIERDVAAGRLRPVDSKQSIISLVGMVVFYFAAQPLMSRILDLDDRDQERFLAERKRNVIDVFLHGVLPPEASTARRNT